jgi:hypothetical protein
MCLPFKVPERAAARNAWDALSVFSLNTEKQIYPMISSV